MGSMFLNYKTGIYGGQLLVGANLNLFWWFVGAGLLFAVLHAISVPLIHRRQADVLARAGHRTGSTGRVTP